MKSPITTHILDTSRGKPAGAVSVELQYKDNNSWIQMAKSKTDSDGRIMEWFDKEEFKVGHYRLIFALEPYFGTECFFPEVILNFTVKSLEEHYHVPLLLSPFGYSTYRGS